MGAVTYPDEEVGRFLRDRYAVLRISTEGPPNPDFTRALGNRPLQWEPTFVFMDPSLRELRRHVGFLPPRAFIGELSLAVAAHHMLRRRNGEALDHLLRVWEELSDTHAAPEAMYWAGIAAYREAGSDRAVLRDHWQRLWDRCPESTWTARSAVFPDQLADNGPAPSRY